MDTWVLLLVAYGVVSLAATVAWAIMRAIQKRIVLRRYRERHLSQHWRKENSRCL